MRVDEYKFLHESGADYVTVFQETYNADAYEKLHLAGRKRIFPYRFDSQERALMGGMRGVGFSALLGLSDFRRDALASALHVYLHFKFKIFLLVNLWSAALIIPLSIVTERLSTSSKGLYFSPP